MPRIDIFGKQSDRSDLELREDEGRTREDERCFVDFLFVDVILGSAV